MAARSGGAARSAVEAGLEERFCVTRWLGSPSLGAPLLRVRDLRYPWRRRARSGVTVEGIASRTRLRPDLARVLKVYHAGGMEETSLVLRRLMTEGDGAGYQLPDELPGDRAFAYSDAEVQYVDRMGWFLFGLGQGGARRFVLPEVTGLYVFPRLYVYAKSAVALQKSSCSLMRLHAVSFSHRDWSTYRHREERDGRVVPSSAFASGLAPGDFAPLPTDIWDAFPSLGVHPLLPPVMEHFGFACADTQQPAHPQLAYNYGRKWAWSVCCAFMAEVHVNARVFLQPLDTIAFVERLAVGFPDASLHPSERGSCHVPWTFEHTVGLMVRAGDVSARHHGSWVDYSMGTQSFFLTYDARADVFVARPPPVSPAVGVAVNRGGVGSESWRGRRKRYRDLDAVGAVPMDPDPCSFRAAPVTESRAVVGGLAPVVQCAWQAANTVRRSNKKNQHSNSNNHCRWHALRSARDFLSLYVGLRPTVARLRRGS